MIPVSLTQCALRNVLYTRDCSTDALLPSRNGKVLRCSDELFRIHAVILLSVPHANVTGDVR